MKVWKLISFAFSHAGTVKKKLPPFVNVVTRLPPVSFTFSMTPVLMIVLIPCTLSMKKRSYQLVIFANFLVRIVKKMQQTAKNATLDTFTMRVGIIVTR